MAAVLRRGAMAGPMTAGPRAAVRSGSSGRRTHARAVSTATAPSFPDLQVAPNARVP